MTRDEFKFNLGDKVKYDSPHYANEGAYILITAIGEQYFLGILFGGAADGFREAPFPFNEMDDETPYNITAYEEPKPEKVLVSPSLEPKQICISSRGAPSYSNIEFDLHSFSQLTKPARVVLKNVKIGRPDKGYVLIEDGELIGDLYFEVEKK